MPDRSTIHARSRRVLLCVGPGGVGKTTCAASLALAAAEDGQSVAVVTIDPSRRLLQALGLKNEDALGESELREESEADQRIDSGVGTVQSDKKIQSPQTLEYGRGKLDAYVLDSRRVLDTIVASCAPADRASAIFQNPIYRASAERLSGALEYASMAQVQMLHELRQYEQIIVDTPPTANAIDFLEAPRKIHDLVDNPAAKLLAGTGKIGMRIVDLGAAAVAKFFQKMAGAAFLQDLAGFLRDFGTVLAEFQRRAGSFESMLQSEQTGVVVVTSPAPFSIREAGSFCQVLQSRGLNVDSILVNGVEAKVPLPYPREELFRNLKAAGILSDSMEDHEEELVALDEAYRLAYQLGQRGERALDELKKIAAKVDVRVALRREHPPEDLQRLCELGRELR